MKIFLLILLITVNFVSYGQDFDSDTTRRKATFYNFSGSELKFDIELTKKTKHTSVIINIEYKDEVKTKKVFIMKSDTFKISTSNVESVTITHRKRILVRIPQRFCEKKSKGKRIKTKRVSLTSGSGGSATSSTVTST